MKDLYERLSKLPELAEAQRISEHFANKYKMLEQNIVPIQLPCITETINLRIGEELKALVNDTRVNTNFMASEIANYIENVSSITLDLVREMANAINDLVDRIVAPLSEFYYNNPEVFERLTFLEIAKEIGFPIYFEVDTELQERLIQSYRKNGDFCDKAEMQSIIFEYYDDDRVDEILQEMINSRVFSSGTIDMISEGIDVYHQRKYGAAGAVFATQMSGMIREIYDEACRVRRFTESEKNEVKAYYELQRCSNDSEKVMLIQVLSRQDDGIILWYEAAEYFLKYLYSSRDEHMIEHPMRNKICHGIQKNYNTKEMNLKLIMCIDILSELAWRVRNEVDAA